MAEYIKMIVISAIAVTLFFGGYLGPDITQLPIHRPILDMARSLDGPVYMFIKIVALLFVMVWVRATLPRIRYDRLMAVWLEGAAAAFAGAGFYIRGWHAAGPGCEPGAHLADTGGVDHCRVCDHRVCGPFIAEESLCGSLNRSSS